MKISSIRPAAALVLVIALLVTIRWMYSGQAQRNPVPPPAPAVPPAVQSAPAISPPQRQQVAAATITAPSPRNYLKEFRTQKDYWVYAHQLLPRAKAGDADAQFYLSKILHFCNYANQGYFENMRQKITLDEALQKAAQQGRGEEQTRTIYARCHEFQTEDASSLGNEQEWLNKATDAGQTAAAATIVQDIVWRQYLELFKKAGATLELPPPVRPGADPQALLLAAARSQDPETLYAIGGAAANLAMLTPERSMVDAYAWKLLACERGYPCNGKFDWVTIGCPNCNADNSDPLGALMQDAENNKANWSAVQQRAQQISASLEAEEWDALGLNSTPAAGN